ncbi:outer membrane beta-barrel family protein [Sinomicrobium sp. M5D2P9]
MKNTKKILIFILVFISYTSFSQTYKGVVVDSQNNPIEYANVIAKSLDDITITGTITNKSGEFEMLVQSRDSFNLTISFIGYRDWSKIMEPNMNLDLGGITMSESISELEEVEVVAKKPIIERKFGRLIFNVENSVVASGYDGMEALKYAPKIDPTSQGIKMIGKSSLAVMVNDRLINLGGKDLEAYLKSLRSENISRIEIITTPPAKFDAQGNSGLVNIILKKRVDIGFDGSVTATYIQRKYAGFMPSTYLNYSTEKLSMAFNIYADNEIKKYEAETSFLYPNYRRNSDSGRKQEIKGLSSGLNLEYRFTNKQKAGVILNGNLWNTDEKLDNIIKYRTSLNNQIDSTLVTPSRNSNDYHYLSTSAYYDIELDSIGSKLQFNYNHLEKNNEDDRSLSSIVYQGDLGTNLNSNSATSNSEATYSVNSFNVDVILPINESKLGFGGKATFIENNSNIDYFDTSTGAPVIDESQSDIFRYNEDILALYTSFEKSFGEKVYLILGLRFENTRTKGYSVTLASENSNSFSTLFPSATLAYDPNENHSFSIGYAKRIDRPGFSDVNPFRTYTDFFSYEAGNPLLLPSITHNIDFSYLFNNNLEVSFYYSLLKDAADYITLSSSNSNIIISRPENFYDQHTLGLDVYYNWEPISWFASNNGFSAYYNDSDSNLPDITLSNVSGYGYYVSTRNTFTLNKENGNSIYVNFFQNFPSYEGLSKIFNRANLQIGARFSFLERKLQLNISASDIFRQNRNRVKEVYQDYIFTSNIYNDIRRLNISLTYKIGNNKYKSSNRKIDDSEKNRM